MDCLARQDPVFVPPVKILKRKSMKDLKGMNNCNGRINSN
jgi:hypothetical protein